MHAAREQIQCGPREDYLLLLLLLNIFLMGFFLEKKIFGNDKYFLEKEHFSFEQRFFFRKETFFTDPARLRKICLHVARELK